MLDFFNTRKLYGGGGAGGTTINTGAVTYTPVRYVNGINEVSSYLWGYPTDHLYLVAKTLEKYNIDAEKLDMMIKMDGLDKQAMKINSDMKLYTLMGELEKESEQE